MIKTYEDWENSLDQNYVRQLSPDAWDLTGSAFEAGQQSQQAKIDELQARIDCLKGSVDWHIEDCELALSMNKNNVWSGGQLEILRVIKKRLEDMLKGNKDEN